MYFALVGDFLDCMGLDHPQLTSEECATVIARLKVQNRFRPWQP